MSSTTLEQLERERQATLKAIVSTGEDKKDSRERRQQLLGPLRRTAPVESRFELGPSSARTQRPGVGGAGSPRGRSPSPRPQGQDSPRARSASPAANRLHSDPWMFSPSGKWDTPLALRHDAR